jgi:hypothetical protein
LKIEFVCLKLNITVALIEDITVALYESTTGSRDEKRATLSPLLQTPQDPIGNLSMVESFVLVLLFTALHSLSTWKV